MSLPIRGLRQGSWLGKAVTFPVLRGATAAFSSVISPPQKLSSNLSFHATEVGDKAERPLVLLYGWLASKAKHMHKFGDFYLRDGCDVLHIKLNPGELMWPTKSHAVVKDILDFANTECPTQPIIAHGFSVGCYLYAETLVRIIADASYSRVGDRLQAQILDSPVDFQGIPFGVANVLANQPLLRKAIELSIRSYLATFEKNITQHYRRASDTIRQNVLLTPTLLLCSHTDKVAAYDVNKQLAQQWKDGGTHVQSQFWPDSDHVGHFLKYPTEYLDIVASFLQHVRSQPLADEGPELMLATEGEQS